MYMINNITNTIRSKRREKTKTGTSSMLIPVTSNDNKCWKTDMEWTAEEEKAAFLYTGKINSAKISAKYLD